MIGLGFDEAVNSKETLACQIQPLWPTQSAPWLRLYSLPVAEGESRTDSRDLGTTLPQPKKGI